MDAIRKRLRNASLNLGPGNRKLIKGDDRREWDSLATPSDPRKFLSYLFACFQIDIILFVSFSFFSWICISFFFFYYKFFEMIFRGKIFFLLLMERNLDGIGKFWRWEISGNIFFFFLYLFFDLLNIESSLWQGLW